MFHVTLGKPLARIKASIEASLVPPFKPYHVLCNKGRQRLKLSWHVIYELQRETMALALTSGFDQHQSRVLFGKWARAIQLIKASIWKSYQTYIVLVFENAIYAVLWETQQP